MQHTHDQLKPLLETVTPVNEGHFAGTLEIRKVRSLSDKIKFRISVVTGILKE
jgi:hypothetical protein